MSVLGTTTLVSIIFDFEANNENASGGKGGGGDDEQKKMVEHRKPEIKKIAKYNGDKQLRHRISMASITFSNSTFEL